MIQKNIINAAHRRKRDNKQQKDAYLKTVLFMRTRYFEKRNLPSNSEVRILVVFKKLIKSGWIVFENEIK
jgi:hypothetical protein